MFKALNSENHLQVGNASGLLFALVVSLAAAGCNQLRGDQVTSKIDTVIQLTFQDADAAGAPFQLSASQLEALAFDLNLYAQADVLNAGSAGNCSGTMQIAGGGPCTYDNTGARVGCNWGDPNFAQTDGLGNLCPSGEAA